MAWERPANIPYPKTWATFDGLKEINGKIPKFRIQDITEDMIEVLCETLLIGFVQEEPLCKYSKFIEDEASLNEGIELYKHYILRNKLTCVCVTDDSDGNAIVVGVSCLDKVSINDPKFQFKGETHARLRSLTAYVYSLNDPFTHFGIDEYLSDRGIYISPEYRGQGIGFEFLKSWPVICKATGFKVVVGTFTSKFSQRLADRAGFGELVSIPYEELAKVDPKYHLPGIEEHTKNIKVLYITA